MNESPKYIPSHSLLRRVLVAVVIIILPISSEIRAQSSTQDSLYHLGMHAYESKDYKNAIRLLTLQLTMMDTSVLTRDLASLNRAISATYAAMGDQKKAYLYFQDYLLIMDSVLNRENRNTRNKLENDLEFQIKDKEIAEKQLTIIRSKELSRSRNIWLWSITCGSLFIALLCLIIYKSYLRKQRIFKKSREQILADKEINVLTANLYGADKERQAISKHIRQTINPSLYKLQRSFLNLEQKDPELSYSSEFQEIKKILIEVDKGLHQSHFALSSGSFSIEPLKTSIRKFLDNIPDSHPIHFTLTLTGSDFILPDEVEICLLRIVQELIQNIIKHSDATQANIQLSYSAYNLGLTITDNGKGFSESLASNGLGLQNIRDRVGSMDGTLNMTFHKGVCVEITIPINEKTSPFQVQPAQRDLNLPITSSVLLPLSSFL